jgi:5-methylcytosine-specific restriction endonuclease McrA
MMETFLPLILPACIVLALLIRRSRRRQPIGRAAWWKWYSGVYLKSHHWRLHRKYKLALYGRRCQECGETRGVIQLHHKNYKHFWHEQVIGFRDTVPLCEECHARKPSRIK